MKKIIGNFIITALFCTLACTNIAPCQPLENVSTHLSKIETSLWGFDYSKESEINRLSRIEQSVFGSADTNSSIEKRIEKINKSLGFETQQEAASSISELMSESVEEADGVSYPQIDQLELKLFSKVYEKENIYKRMDRLEKKIFGSTQDGDLASRTEKLKGYLRMDSQTNPSIYAKDSYDDFNNPYSGRRASSEYDPSLDTYGSDIMIQVSGLEQSLFGKTFSQDPVGLRLNRLERKIFQRDFSSDDDLIRMQRLQAAASAKKTAKYYDMNKAQKFASTGMQIGTLVLMILALIL